MSDLLATQEAHPCQRPCSLPTPVCFGMREPHEVLPHLNSLIMLSYLARAKSPSSFLAAGDSLKQGRTHM